MSGPLRGVLLIGMGAPRNLDEVRPFLEALFSDGDLLRLPLPGFLQGLIARFIAHRRAPKATARYASIGGGSPLVSRIEHQAGRLHRRLNENETGQVRWITRAAMRYGGPSIDDGLAALLHEGIDELVALPMYSQLSSTTTGSAMNELRRALRRQSPSLPLRRGAPFLATEAFLDAFAQRVAHGYGALEGRPPCLFVAHSLPERLVVEGDPYKDEVLLTVEGLKERADLPSCHVAWQGQVGPMRWIGPTLNETLGKLAAAGTRQVFVVAASFLFDHVETLVELDVEGAKQARDLGIEGFHRAQAFNEGEDLTRVLEALVRLEGWETGYPRWRPGL